VLAAASASGAWAASCLSAPNRVFRAMHDLTERAPTGAPSRRSALLAPFDNHRVGPSIMFNSVETDWSVRPRLSIRPEVFAAREDVVRRVRRRARSLYECSPDSW